MLCGRCGQENPEGFAFCGSCGAALDGDEAGQQQRKTVTVVFCDLAGSTALGDSTDPEVLAPLALKGKPEPVPAFRLLAVGAAPDRLHDRPFVGRTRELELLGGAWERASAERTCELVTVLGEAGVGKSRLVAEALERMNARVVRARCLPYGEEITYWPVVEVIKQLGALPSDPAAAAAIRSLLGESEQATSVEEIAWAFRKLLGEQAPLVVLVDDIQWGADTFLDLVEHVALLSAAVPLLLVCVARPELLDRRPAWSVAVRLQPLDDDEVGALLGDRVAPGLRARIERAAGGNPLFVTEMLAMAGDGEDEVEVPPTLSALLTARLDQLDPSERRIVERGAVEGLSPDEPHVTPRLAALVRRELIRPHPAQLPGDDGFRFRHLLIRDAAYDALPKAVRAELHERFGAWLEEKGALVELDEVVGYHFEQAAGYRAELGRPDPALALRAGNRLAAAGQRVLDRGDERAAARLLERALMLTLPLRLDVHAELALAQAHWDDPERAAPIADDAAVRAGEAGDETGAALARAMAAAYRLSIAQSTPDELEALLLEARRRLEEAEAHVGLAYVWSALGYGVANARGRADDWAAASEQSLHHSRLAGRQGLARATDLGVALCLGSRPADEALVTVERLLAEMGRPELLLSRAWLLAMLDRGEEARRDADEADARLRELSGTRWPDWHLAEISGLAGDHEDASNRLRIVCEWLEATEQLPHLATYLSFLGRSLCRLGRFDEAAPFAERARAIGKTIGAGGDSVPDNYLWRQVLARVLAHRGELAEAERHAREAVAGSEQSDSLDDQCLALWDLAEVLAAAERPDEAEAALEQALERCRRKKNLARAAQVRRRLDSLRHDASPA